MAAPQVVTGRKRVISLIRVSKAEQAANGPARQRTLNEKTAATYSLDIAEEIVVVDVSGRHVNTSRQFQKLFALLKQPDIHGIVAPEQSRLVRMGKFGDLGILDHFEGKTIWLPDGPINPSSPTQRLTVALKAVIDGNELGVITSRTETTKENLRKAGVWVAGNHNLPVGVKFVRERDEDGRIVRKYWKHVQPHADLMKMAFELADAGGMTFEDIAQRMGHGWTAPRLRSSLTNHVWIGRFVYDKVQRGEEVQPTYTRKPLAEGREPRHYKKKVARPADEVINTKIDLASIVDDAVFYRVRQMVIDRKIAWSQKASKHDDALLQKLARCRCGKPMYMHHSDLRGKQQKRAVYYYCATRCSAVKDAPCADSAAGAKNIVQPDLDATVVGALREELLKAIVTIAARTKALVKPDNRGAAKTFEFQMAKLEMQIKNITESKDEGLMTAKLFREKLAKFESEIAKLRAQMPADDSKPDIDWTKLQTLVATAFARLPYLSFEDRRAVVKAAVRSVVVNTLDQTIEAVTLHSGWLAACTKELSGCSAAKTFRATSDLTITFDKPLVIKAAA